jgi:F-type H+-transporting ATPase subunit a
MMAGHALLKILAGFSWQLFKKGSAISIFVGIFPLLMVTAITGLEVGVSCLQAFIFAVLLIVYFKDSLTLH